MITTAAALRARLDAGEVSAEDVTRFFPAGTGSQQARDGDFPVAALAGQLCFEGSHNLGSIHLRDGRCGSDFRLRPRQTALLESPH